MNRVYLGIKFALSYFTLLPIRFSDDDDLSHPCVIKSMLLSFPFVGVLLAALSIGIFLLLEPLQWLGAIIAAVAYMVLYGFIHTEAVIDVADAVYAAHSGKDPYVVIKDPTVGAMGVLYGVSFTLLKIAALSMLLIHHLYAPFIAIALISRLGLLVLIRIHEFRSSFAAQLHEHLKVFPLLLVLAMCAAVGYVALSWHFILWMGFGIVTAVLLAYGAKRSLGFINGDVLGMALEGVELVLIVTVLFSWH